MPDQCRYPESLNACPKRFLVIPREVDAQCINDTWDDRNLGKAAQCFIEILQERGGEEWLPLRPEEIYKKSREKKLNMSMDTIARVLECITVRIPRPTYEYLALTECAIRDLAYTMGFGEE